MSFSYCVLADLCVCRLRSVPFQFAIKTRLCSVAVCDREHCVVGQSGRAVRLSGWLRRVCRQTPLAQPPATAGYPGTAAGQEESRAQASASQWGTSVVRHLSHVTRHPRHPSPITPSHVTCHTRHPSPPITCHPSPCHPSPVTRHPVTRHPSH